MGKTGNRKQEEEVQEQATAKWNRSKELRNIEEGMEKKHKKNIIK